MWNAISPGYELVSLCPIPATITITPANMPSRLLLVFIELRSLHGTLNHVFHLIHRGRSLVLFPLTITGYHHHHHVALPAQISLTLSHHPSLSSIAPGRSFRLHPVSAQSCYIGFSWSSNLCLSMWKDPQEYIAYEFVLTSPAVFHISSSSHLDSFHDGW